jgi:hypothetical protein
MNSNLNMKLVNSIWQKSHKFNSTNTTTKKGHIAIQISSETTKKSVSENSQFRTTIPRKLLSLCETLTFARVQSQALRNTRNWNNRKTFLIIMSSIHKLWFTIHRKLFATNQHRKDLAKWLENLSVFDITFNANVLRCSTCRYAFAIKLTSKTFWNKLINATT